MKAIKLINLSHPDTVDKTYRVTVRDTGEVLGTVERRTQRLFGATESFWKVRDAEGKDVTGVQYGYRTRAEAIAVLSSV